MIGDKRLDMQEALSDIAETLILNGFCVSDMYQVDKANCERFVELNNEVYDKLHPIGAVADMQGFKELTIVVREGDIVD